MNPEEEQKLLILIRKELLEILQEATNRHGGGFTSLTFATDQAVVKSTTAQLLYDVVRDRIARMDRTRAKL